MKPSKRKEAKALEKKIGNLKVEIARLEKDKTLDLETRTRLIAAKQHKILCAKTRLDLFEGKVNHEVFLTRY